MKLKILLAITGISISIFLTSCLKDSPYIDYSKTKPIIEFGLSPASGQLNYFGYAGDTAGSITIDTAIALVVASPQVLSSSVTAKVKVDESQITSFNDDNGTNYVLLPDSLYKLTTTATILSGYRIGRLPITLNLSKFDSIHHYALPVVITGATTSTGDSLIVSSNSSLFIWTFDRDTTEE